MASDKKNSLLLLFDRPQEPVFMPKGDKKTVFSIPTNYLPAEYQPIAKDIVPRLKILLTILLSSFSEFFELGRHENFSVFIPRHQELAGLLIKIFLDMESIDDLLSIAVYARDQINFYLFNYAFSVALRHRRDTQDLNVPPLIQSFPDKFVDPKVFTKAREIANIVPEGLRVPINTQLDYTASDLDEEHRLAYFREDLGINLHHWHWHEVYPGFGPIEIVDKNRRSELFYYMHQQIIARYNFERLANKLKRTERFNDWTKPIKEAYFPKLYSAESSREWPGRVANQTLKDVARENPQQYIKLDSHNETIELTEEKGIDILGNIVEATILSPNPDLYGNLHNMGHNFIASVHDPDFRNLEPLAVMGFTDTAMRDPIFYRWHAYIDHIFQEHKARLPQYDEKRLNFPGITVSEIEVQSEGATKTNILKTFWQKSDIDLSGGMNFQPRGPIFIKFKHLQQHPFTYKITVNNNNNGNKPGTCRIFLAPKFDERNDPWLFRDQKNMFIELDKFTVSLKQGKNTITRASDQSSVTIPFETIFGTSKLPEGSPASKRSPLCGCGWPQHMLIPKGTPEGMPCELFVMISDYENDKINQSTEGECNDGASYCGIKDKLYPDRQSMGFPFDRMPRAGVKKLQQFLTPNMRVQYVTIQFSDGTST